MPEKIHHPPEARAASTVILVRDHHKMPEVYLLRRGAGSGFMGGLYVFPGGVVDREDCSNEWLPHLDTSPELVEALLGPGGPDLDKAIGYCIAAVRETLEEAGTFLADPCDGAFSALEEIVSLRLKSNLPEFWFRKQVMEDSWRLGVSRLGRWSHWITPERMTKRYDTRFFIAWMPDGQTCSPDNMETFDGLWISPMEALEQNLLGRIPLSPPTVVTLTQMLPFPSSEHLQNEIQGRPWGTPMMPRLELSGEGPVIIEPWDPDFDSETPIDAPGLRDRILPPGEWFSRIWCHEGVWKPVGL